MKNPYEDYEIFDVEINESITKYTSVFAKDSESAKKYFEDLCLDKIDMSSDIDEYKKTVTVYSAEESGRSTADYTVPLWWYKEGEE